MLKEIRNLLPQLLTIHWNLFGVISWSQREIPDSSLDCYAQNKIICLVGLRGKFQTAARCCLRLSLSINPSCTPHGMPSFAFTAGSVSFSSANYPCYSFNLRFCRPLILFLQSMFGNCESSCFLKYFLFRNILK